MYGELRDQVTAEPGVSGALHAVCMVAARAVPGADAASVTRRQGGSFATVATSDLAATRADALQYELGTGPCVDAVEKGNVFRSRDLASDRRWPNWGPVVADSIGLRSVLSIRLTLDDEDAMAGLNMYSYQLDAFPEASVGVATLLASHAAVIVSELLAREKATSLEAALASSRDIGVAMGVLMATYKITRDDAFDLLRIASQRSNRKLRDIATDVADTGMLEMP